MDIVGVNQPSISVKVGVYSLLIVFSLAPAAAPEDRSAQNLRSASASELPHKSLFTYRLSLIIVRPIPTNKKSFFTQPSLSFFPL